MKGKRHFSGNTANFTDFHVLYLYTSIFHYYHSGFFPYVPNDTMLSHLVTTKKVLKLKKEYLYIFNVLFCNNAYKNKN